MRKNFLLMMFAILLLGGCKKDKKVRIYTITEKTPTVDVAVTSVSIRGYYYGYPSDLKSVTVAYTQNSDYSSASTILAENHNVYGADDYYYARLINLEPNTTYYYYCIFDTGYGSTEGKQWSFTTQSVSATAVTTSSVSNITQTTATCGGNVTSDGGAAVTARGVCWGTSQDPTVSNSHTTDGSGTGSFTSNITGLTGNTTYYVRAYATNSAGTSYGEQESFTTQTTPTVTTSSVSNISQTTATCGGNVTSDGGAAVTARGVCWSTSPSPMVSNSHTTDGTGTGSFTSSITGLTASTRYYVRAYATNANGTSYGEQKSFTTQSGGGGEINGHAYVDLGLPSGLLWATCNVGADSPEGYGNYYAWGETEPNGTYNWNTYKWCNNGDDHNLTKYNTDSNYGIVDNKTVLDPEDDAAHVNWGGNWRMPTREEMHELESNCTWKRTTYNSVKGYRVTGSNGNSIFLPAAGCYDDCTLYVAGSDGYYWSSSLDTEYPSSAYHLDFYSGRDMYGIYRRYGLSVRPVCPSQK